MNDRIATEGVPRTTDDSLRNKAADTHDLREEVLRWLYTVVCAVCCYVIIALIVYTIYHPDVEAQKAAASKLVLEPQYVAPEPLEALLFRLGVAIILPALFLFYHLFSRWKFEQLLTRPRVFLIASIVPVALTAVLIYAGCAVQNEYNTFGSRLKEYTYETTHSNFSFYFTGYFLGNYPLVYLLVLFPAVVFLFFVGFKKRQWDEHSRVNRSVRWVGYTTVGAVLIATLAMNIFQFPYANDNKYDFNAVYYSMTQVHAGVPMLVNGFTNTYGLYPHFLNLLFRFTGLSVLLFSGVLSVLLFASFILNFLVLKKFVRNEVILFLGFTTMLFFSYFNRKLINNFDCFFALFPIRYVIPSLLTFLARYYFFKQSKKLYYTIFALMAASVLWNPEIGLVCYLSWLAVNIYIDWFGADGHVQIKAAAKHIAVAAIMLPAVFYTFKGLVWLSYGDAPDFTALWRTMLVFGKTGFMLLPMSLLHPWNIVALALVCGFAYAFVRLYKKVVTPRSAMVLLLSFIGLGYFYYFEGRSHSVTLTSSSGFSILLLTILADELWAVAKRVNILALNLLFSILLFLLSFSFAELVYAGPRLHKAVYQEEDKTAQIKEQEFIQANRDFMLSKTQEGEKVYILTASKFQGLYFDGYKRRSAFNPGIIDMALKPDIDRFQQVLRDSSFSIFLEPELFNYPFMQYARAEIAALYNPVALGKNMFQLKKRKMPVPVTSFFSTAGGLAFYRKYTDDSTGLKARIDDALEGKKITLFPEFSVHILFYSRPQVFPDAVLASNLEGDNGFAIFHQFNTHKYTFVIGGAGFSVPLAINKWVYCVMNVFTDHVEIYENGVLKLSEPLPGPARNSSSPLYIGRQGYMAHYVGAIAEVAIANYTADSASIKQNWQQIKQVVKE